MDITGFSGHQKANNCLGWCSITENFYQSLKLFKHSLRRSFKIEDLKSLSLFVESIVSLDKFSFLFLIVYKLCQSLYSLKLQIILFRSLRENLHELPKCSFSEEEDSYQETELEPSLQWILHLWLAQQGRKFGRHSAGGCNVWLGQNHKKWGQFPKRATLLYPRTPHLHFELPDTIYFLPEPSNPVCVIKFKWSK